MNVMNGSTRGNYRVTQACAAVLCLVQGFHKDIKYLDNLCVNIYLPSDPHN